MGESGRECPAAAHVGLRVGRVPDVQLAERQEGDLSWKVHLVELHQDLGAHLIRLHNVVKQPGHSQEPGDRRERQGELRIEQKDFISLTLETFD